LLIFGAAFPSYANPQNEYLYNKKELQEELGQYDYGARFYDPVIARWMSVDPLAEKNRRFSTYVYGKDSPIIMVDPDGMFDQYFDQSGNFLALTNVVIMA
jgi:RHS repeat-associated protein